VLGEPQKKNQTIAQKKFTLHNVHMVEKVGKKERRNNNF